MASDQAADGSELGMDVICRFSGHLAHELNNLLTPIIACGQMLKDGIPKDDPMAFCAEQVADAGNRCLALSRKLQIIGSRRAQGHVVDLASLLHEAVASFRREAPPGVRVVEETPVTAGDEGLLVKTDMEQFIYLVTELLTNAATAMPQGGAVTVSVEAREAGAVPGEAPHGWVRLLVRDEGAGISPEVQARMYEPYFSTQGQERDKGLGLTLVYGIVRRAGGIIRCTSAPGEGAAFEILFPRRTGVEAAVV